MDPVAFSFGAFDIHWYGVFVAVGFLAGLWTAGRRGLIYGLSPEKTADLGPWIIIGALIGARSLYVITYWDDDFAGKTLLNIFKIRQGGLVFYGGFIGAVLSTVLYTRLKNVPLWQIADAFAPSIALGHAFGRIGCLMTGCCYGKACSLPWAITFPNGHYSHPSTVHPTQIYESSLNLGLYLALDFLYRRKRFEGQVFAIYLMSYALLRSFVELFRGDYTDQKITGLLTPGQQVGIAIFLAGAALYFIRSKTSVPRSESATS